MKDSGESNRFVQWNSQEPHAEDGVLSLIALEISGALRFLAD